MAWSTQNIIHESLAFGWMLLGMAGLVSIALGPRKFKAYIILILSVVWFAVVASSDIRSMVRFGRIQSSILELNAGMSLKEVEHSLGRPTMTEGGPELTPPGGSAERAYTRWQYERFRGPITFTNGSIVPVFRFGLRFGYSLLDPEHDLYTLRFDEAGRLISIYRGSTRIDDTSQ